MDTANALDFGRVSLAVSSDLDAPGSPRDFSSQDERRVQIQVVPATKRTEPIGHLSQTNEMHSV